MCRALRVVGFLFMFPCLLRLLFMVRALLQLVASCVALVVCLLFDLRSCWSLCVVCCLLFVLIVASCFVFVFCCLLFVV